METVPHLAIPFETVESKLMPDDDHEFWRVALTTLSDDFIRRYAEQPSCDRWALIVGACSHWRRPNQDRWTAAGGFAWPEGYGPNPPELNWTAIFAFQDRIWLPIAKLPGKRLTVLTAALPSRTLRHRQAAVYVRWTPGHEKDLFGFRKIGAEWKCVAALNEKARGRIAQPVG